MSQAETTSITPCPVAELARNAQANTDAFEHAELAVHGAAQDRKVDLGLQKEALVEDLRGIEERASHLLASSGAGAMFQLHLIASWADCINTWVPEHSDHARDCDEFMKGIRRMLYSAQAYIETVSAENPDDACGEYYMSRRLNPHRLIKEALAAEGANHA